VWLLVGCAANVDARLQHGALSLRIRRRYLFFGVIALWYATSLDLPLLYTCDAAAGVALGKNPGGPQAHVDGELGLPSPHGIDWSVRVPKFLTLFTEII
jgi:hypothetical protein